MPNLDSTGKQGRSMDCSQLLDFKKKYKTVQQQNSKTPPGDQKQKPAFNSNRLGGGGSENGASWYYNQRGNTLIYDRFFGDRRFSNNYSIDSRFSEFAAWYNSQDNVRYTYIKVDALTADEIIVTGTVRTNSGATETVTITRSLIVFGPTSGITPLVRQTVYLNNTGGVISVQTSDSYNRYYSNGQFFLDDGFQLDMSNTKPRI